MQNSAAAQPEFLATCPKGLEALLARELKALGAAGVSESVAACYFHCPLPIAYAICMGSRVANRIVLLLWRGDVDSNEALVDVARRVDWAEHFGSDKRLTIDFNGSNAFVRHARYGAQLVKDGLNDSFAARGQGRVVLDNREPEVKLYARLFKRKFSLGIDLVGASMHQRGYRQDGGTAPLKENLAAALLMLCDWPAMAREGASFVDPLCGSGTLVIEAILQAANIAPGYMRAEWPLLQLASADHAAWRDCVQASAVDLQAVKIPGKVFGSDANATVIKAARANLQAAGLGWQAELFCAPLESLATRADMFSAQQGLLLTNPPYGQRLGERGDLQILYAALGQFLKTHCQGWQAGILTDDAELGWSTGLRSFRQHKVFNGSIACQLLRYRVAPENVLQPRQPGKPQRVAAGPAAVRHEPIELGESALMLANRLRKNLRRLKPWLAGQAQPCFRVYDADLPEYAVAIDCYSAIPCKAEGSQGAASYLHLQEYAAPASVDEKIAQRRLRDAVSAVCEVFAVPESQVSVKRRQRQRGKSQYDKLDAATPDLLVQEHGRKFIVNLGKYLDTGLFLDHRPLRRLLGERCRGKRFLNLFCYTAAATVHAACGGARSSVSVDMSRNYLAWARRNFELNELQPQQHVLERADSFDWLRSCERKFDVILLDPPSFSNSARMDRSLDIQRDHAELIGHCAALLDEGGELYFSTNRRGFKLAKSLQESYTIEDLTEATHDPDFRRPRPAHFCWRIVPNGSNAPAGKHSPWNSSLSK